MGGITRATANLLTDNEAKTDINTSGAKNILRNMSVFQKN
jgi:hypothetical protein